MALQSLHRQVRTFFSNRGSACVALAALSIPLVGACAVYDRSLLSENSQPVQSGGSVGSDPLAGGGSASGEAPTGGGTGAIEGGASASSSGDSGGSGQAMGGGPQAGGGDASQAGTGGVSQAGAGSAPQAGSGGAPAAGTGGVAGGGSAGSAGVAGADPATHELALGKAVTASSQQTGNEALHGNDGDLASKWCAKNRYFPQWWRVDLGTAHKLSAFSVLFEQSDKKYSYQIETSQDDTSYALQASMSDTGAVQGGAFPANISARYVRISITAAEDVTLRTWACFFEFSITGT